MVMARELSAILGLQRASLVRTGLQSIGPDDLANRTSVKVRQQICKVRRIAAFANAETRAALLRPDFCVFKYLINFPLQRHPDHSARDPNLGGLIPLDSYLSLASGAGTVERSLLMAKSTVRFISETTPRTFR